MFGGWAETAARIDAERLGPLMHRVIGGRGIAQPELEARFHLAYRQTSVLNRLLLQELAICLRAFAIADIGIIVLKGAAQAEAVYGDIGLPPMVEVDVLVHPRDRSAACRVLERLGYALARVEMRPGAAALVVRRIPQVPVQIDVAVLSYCLRPAGNAVFLWLLAAAWAGFAARFAVMPVWWERRCYHMNHLLVFIAAAELIPPGAVACGGGFRSTGNASRRCVRWGSATTGEPNSRWPGCGLGKVDCARVFVPTPRSPKRKKLSRAVASGRVNRGAVTMPPRFQEESPSSSAQYTCSKVFTSGKRASFTRRAAA